MSRAAASELDVLKRIMPGLRRLALFGNKSPAIISTETGIELEDLEQWVKDHGRPTLSAIEDLEDQLAGVDTRPVAIEEDLGETVHVPAPQKPIVFSKPAPVATPAAPVKPPAAKPAPSPQPPAAPKVARVQAPAPPPMKATTKGKRKQDSDPERWRKVAQALLDNPEAKESDVVKKAGIPTGSWGGFKVRTFGKGKISPEKLKKYLRTPPGMFDNPSISEFSEPSRQASSTKRRAAPPPIVAAAGPRPGCASCGGFTVHVRCRGSLIEVCPTCLAEREQGVLERTLALAEFVTPKASAA